jgi:trk system potassium uptake protein TrkH
MSNLLAVINVLSKVVMLFAAAMAVPLALSEWLGDGAQAGFERGILVTVALGALAWFATRRAKQELQVRDGVLLVVLVWAVAPAFAALPLWFHLDGMSATDAYFEAVSGLTTTGATVLTGLDGLPASINFWRGLLHWIGGMGIVVLAVAILPLLGVGGMQIYKAEAPGPMKDSKLTPRITETAKGLWIVYVGLTAMSVVALWAAGMSWLDAFVHGFSAISTGGFSTHDASVGHFNSPLIEAILIATMLAGGMNFTLHLLAWQRRDFIRPFLRDTELQSYLVVLGASIVVLTVHLAWLGKYPSLEALRYAAFNVVSVATTTGFANADYLQWSVFAPLWMLFLGMFVTCSGSTGGGTKMVRAMLVLRQGLREIRRLVHPQAVLPIKLGHQVVPDNVVFAVLAYVVLYLASHVALTFVLVASGMVFDTALSAVIACMNTIGPGLNEIGPVGNYQGLTGFQTWVCSFAMLLGRLEIFTLLAVLMPMFWKK